MENINILINKKTRQVNLSKSVIGNDGENLQENLIFSFNDEFVNGTARLELIKQGLAASYVMLEKVGETYQLPVQSVMTKGGRLTMQLVITEGTNNEEIPIFKSNVFYLVVNSSINAEIEEDEEYPQWIDVANTKLNELDNIDIDIEKVNHTATITITKKDETQEIVNIYDGEQGPQGIQGPEGPAGKDGKDGVDGKDGKDGTNGTNGKDGKDGENGQDGYSPIANVSKSGNVATISITDKNGTTSATINDGTNGTNGVDGFSPSASVSQSGNITTISITDKEGTTTASIDTSNAGITIDTGSNEYVTYLKFSNGILIQYGVVIAPGNQNYADYTLPIAYKNKDSYEIFANTYYGGNDYSGSNAIVTITTPQKVNENTGWIYNVRSNSSTFATPRMLNWFTIGFWK